MKQWVTQILEFEFSAEELIALKVVDDISKKITKRINEYDETTHDEYSVKTNLPNDERVFSNIYDALKVLTR